MENDFAPFLICLLLTLAPAAAFAQSACLPHGQLVDLLDNRYTEKRIAMGLESKSRLLEVFVSADGSTWSMAITDPNGVACLVAAGKDWMEVEPKGDGT